MSVNFLHYAWPVSPYSAKTRAYLTFKRIPFVEVAPSAITLFGDIRKAVGAAVMPTVVTPEGQWMQDSTEIIDALETRFPRAPVTPRRPSSASPRSYWSCTPTSGCRAWPCTTAGTGTRTATSRCASLVAARFRGCPPRSRRWPCVRWPTRWRATARWWA
ncbi:MAG: glutathione S-transferase N-terminal domain-containing protein [Sandaracinaceae bacterium]|nr:glutathione S-transferase N-terminal domain-containing protein [Sandaracinaceae bacterium]